MSPKPGPGPIPNTSTGPTLSQAAEDSPQKDAAEAWEDQLNMLVGTKWCNDPPQSQGAVNPEDGRVAGLSWSSDTMEIFPQTSGATSRELGKAIRGDLVALQAGFEPEPAPQPQPQPQF